MIIDILKLFGYEGDGMSRFIDFLGSPSRLDLNGSIEPWRLGVKSKPYIYHEPLLNQKFIRLFKGYYFAIGDTNV